MTKNADLDDVTYQGPCIGGPINGMWRAHGDRRFVAPFYKSSRSPRLDQDEYEWVFGVWVWRGPEIDERTGIIKMARRP